MSAPLVHELRVLAGPQAGARMVLAMGCETQVGSVSSRGCQLALRDPRVREERIRLKVRENDVRIKLLCGTVDIGGQALTGPCAADWPHFVPMRVGDTVLAFGEAGSPRWAEVLAAALKPKQEVALGAGLPVANESSQAAHATSGLRRRRPEAWLAMGGGVVTAVAAGLLALVSVVTPAQSDGGTAQQRLARVLQASEFRGLRAETGGDGQLLVRGDVLTLAHRADLDRALALADVAPGVQVRVAEQVAAAVRDVYRMNGVVAESLPITSLAQTGTVSVTTREADLERLQNVAAAARRDVPGLAALNVDNTAPRIAPAVTPLVDDPGKRVSSVVPGETPYVVTADGTRYFIGALLPSGHRLASITDQQVLLSKDGVVSPLNF